MNTADQGKWIARAQAGDAVAFGHLAESYGNAVLATAFGRVGDYCAAEDIAQDALLLAFEKLGALRHPSAFPAWLLRITRNLCVRWHRNRSYRAQSQQDGAALCARLGYEQDPSGAELLHQQETRQVLWTALEKLSSVEREAILMFYFHEHSVAEAARAAGVSQAALRKRLQRARDRLRDVLHEEVESGLLSVGRERRLKDRMLAAAPVGALFSKLHNAEAVLPSAVQLWIAGLHNTLSALGFKAATVGAVAVAGTLMTATAGVYQITTHSEDSHPVVGSQESAAEPAAGTAVEQTVSVSSRPAPPTPASKPGDRVVPAAIGTKAKGSRIIAGTVRDASGSLLSGARIEALRKTGTSGCSAKAGPRECIASATTDKEGQYRIAGLPDDDEVLLLATHSEWAVAGRKIDTGDLPGGVDFVLAPTAVAAGRVVDGFGNGLAGAQVTIGTLTLAAYKEGDAKPDPLAGDNFSATAFGGIMTAATDGQGRFHFPNLPRGGVVSRVRARKQGYGVAQAESAEGLKHRQADFASKGSTSWSSAHLPLPDTEIRIALKLSGALEGRASYADGQPAGGAVVSVQGGLPSRFSDGSGGFYSAEAVADEDGRFRIEDVPAIELDQIEARLEQAVSLKKSIRIRSSETSQIDLVLKPTGHIRGTLFAVTSGQPVPKARIHYQQEGVHGILPLTWTDGRGRFELKGLAPGRWRINSNRGEWDLDHAHHPNAKDHWGIPVVLRAGETISNLELYASPGKFITRTRGVLSGRVSSASGHPLPMAPVWLLVNGMERKIQADKAGQYRFASVSPGKVTVYAAHPKELFYGVSEAVVTAKAEGRADIVVNLGGARIQGLIQMENGRAPTVPLRLSVHEQRAGNPRWRRLDLDTAGNFDSGILSPGTYRFVAEIDEEGYMVADRPQDLIYLAAGDLQRIPDLAIRRMTGVLAGRARYADGRPFAHEPVIAGSSAGLLRGETDEQGRFRLEPLDGENAYLALGEYPQEGRAAGDWAWITQVLIGTTALDIVVGPMGHLTGKLDIAESETATLRLTSKTSVHVSTEAGPPDFDIPMQAGVYRGSIEYESKTKELGEIVIEAGETTNLGLVEFPKGESILRGSVTYGGQPLAADMRCRASLRGLDEGDNADSRPRVHEDADGAFHAEQLVPGRYLLGIMLTVQGTQRIEHRILEFGDGTTEEVHVDFPVGTGVLEGRMEPTGPRSAVLCVEAGSVDLNALICGKLQEGMESAIRAQCAQDGSFAVQGLVPGDYDVLAVAMGEDRAGVYGTARVTVGANGVSTPLHIQADQPMPERE